MIFNTVCFYENYAQLMVSKISHWLSGYLYHQSLQL